MRRNDTAIAAAVLLASGSAPAECAFCMPGTAGQFAEMRTRTPVST